MRTNRILVGLTVMILASPVAALAAERCDAAEILRSVTSNLRGPEGKMAVATGTLTLGRDVKKVKLAHYVSPDGTEAFQGEDRGNNDEFLKRIRLIRDPGGQATTLVLVPTMRQGRKMRFAPTHPLFGSGEIHHYLLLPSRALEHDYAFECEVTSGGGALLTGTRNAGAELAPYPGVRLHASKRGSVWVVEKADCQGTDDFPPFSETFDNYTQVKDGGWAPADIELNGVRLRLEWRVAPAVEWIASDNGTLMDRQEIP